MDDQGFCSQVILPLDWLPIKADEPDLPGFYISVFPLLEQIDNY